MSLKAIAIPEIPEEEARVARAACPKGNLNLKIRGRTQHFLCRCRFC